jgi:hypothetical protein
MKGTLKTIERIQKDSLGRVVSDSITLAGVCIFLGLAAGFIGYFYIPRNGNDPMSDWGNFGSFLQGTTASFWALAGVFLIFAAFMAQKKQLTLQQKQFEQQSFENHFFQLLNVHHDIVDDLQFENSDEQGRNTAGRFWLWVRNTYYDKIHGQSIEQDTEALAVAAYEEIFDKQPKVFGHYFRNLYHIIKFVDDSSIDDKKRYTSLVRAQLSSYEHILLHYNGLSEYGVKKFKPLIEQYALLENMGPGLLFNPEHPTSYSRGAFGDDANLFKYLADQHRPAPTPLPAADSKPT